ncbi:hypothetical protein KQI68_06820 [Peptoniphilus sp. MSJ-1]|uniref:Spo0E like sporulation regulatory protein n=1 Tax=Peptoniphilus ovalis TaxID=2841503 RepID=A0ABS6FHV1_9FIRM|nr:hypothetical protein [Peptoniphilus ovalis]MBU5669551.1 hypothetical protein [Peptoniphilus ovalis]
MVNINYKEVEKLREKIKSKIAEQNELIIRNEAILERMKSTGKENSFDEVMRLTEETIRAYGILEGIEFIMKLY